MFVDVGEKLETFLAGEIGVNTFRVIETVKILFLDGIVDLRLSRHRSELD
jgi:hypothetical protein